MSASISAARSALAAAIVAGSIRVSDSPGDTSPPVVHIYGGGIDDLRGIARGQLPYAFRLVLQPQGGTPATESAGLAALLEALLVVLRGLDGFRIDAVSPDVMRIGEGGAQFLSVDMTVSTMIDL